MVPLIFSKLSNSVHKLEGPAKVGKLEGLGDVMLLNDVPSVHLLLQGCKFLPHERRDTSPARDAGLAR